MVDSKKQSVVTNEKPIAAAETKNKAAATSKTAKKVPARAKKAQKEVAAPSFVSCRVWPD